MKKSLIKMLGIAAVAWTMHASAAGIGGIDVRSALGAPLSANVELVSVSKDEKSSLVARLASQEAYKSAGLDYPFNNKFKFTIESRADGSSYIHATSQQPINDPFVSLMIELKWASGRVMREYTFLLDPPGYQAEQPAATPVQPIAPIAAPAPVSVQPIAPPAPVAAPVVNSVPPAASVAPALTPVEYEAEQPAKSKPVKNKARTAKSKPQAEAVVSKPVETGDITVQQGDTLNKIAVANKVGGVSLERMIVALYRAKVDQFDGQNMNRIKTGKVLRRPDEKELNALTQSEAKNEIHAQVSDWNAYRQHLASAAPTSSKQQAPQQSSSGKVSSSVADKTPPVKETAKEVLKLSKGDATTDKVAAGKTSNQDKKNAAQEEAIAKAKAAEEDRARKALLEKNLQDMKHLAELKTQAAALAAKPASAPAVASAVAAPVSAVAAVAPVQAVSQVQAASPVQIASAAIAASPVAAVSAPKPVVKPVVKPTVVEEPSLFDQLMEEPLYLGGGAAALLGLGGLAIAMRRRKGKAAAVTKPDALDFASTSTHIAAPEIPSPDTGDFTVQSGQTQMLAPLSTEDDPISEADLFLSFGRDVQAEEILQDALQSAADKTPIRMKLLDIYAARKDNAAFEDIASQVKHSGDATAWKKAEGMGKKLDPKNPLYSGTTQVEDSDSATMQTAVLSAKPDMPTKTVPRTADFLSSDEPSVEPNMGATTKMIADMEAAVAAPKSSVMDFDVGAHPIDTHALDTKPKETLSDLGDLVFDITATHPPMPAAKGETVAEKPADDGMSFLMDFPVETAEPKAPVAKPHEFDLSDINLDLGNDLSAKTGAGSEQWHEVATKLDLARAYQEMTDYAGAKEILNEVLQEGDAEQRAAAEEIMKQLG
ncbi:MAG: FimV/HubP family polar landmark protein [Gallionella sp.]